MKDDELLSKFTFRSTSQSSLYVYLLLQKCEEFENQIHNDSTNIKELNSGFCGDKKKLKEYLKTYFELCLSVQELKSEINDLQKYSITNKACLSDDAIDKLKSYYEKIEKDLLVMFSLINMKTSEISSSRITVTNILISIVAIIISIIFAA